MSAFLYLIAALLSRIMEVVLHVNASKMMTVMTVMSAPMTGVTLS